MNLVRIAVLLLCLSTAVPAEEFRYPAGAHASAELQFLNEVPVLTLQGTPEEIGTQLGKLTKQAAPALIQYPQELAKALGKPQAYPLFVKLAVTQSGLYPPEQLREIKAIAKAADLPEDALISANLLPDMYRAFGCTSLMIHPVRSSTGGMLFGRNLDYFTLGKLHQYSLVMVYRPTGKKAFVSIGFPGLVGCLSGMNEDGLCLAVHEVYSAQDKSPIFQPGEPYTMVFRRILETCSTVDEAVELLKDARRTTMLNLAVCDREHTAVLEITPNSVAVRKEVDGLCACANHFCTPELRVMEDFPDGRFLRVQKNAPEQVSVAELARRLDQVNQGNSTLQTMIFEPATLTLHVALGPLPSSSQPLRKLDLSKLLRKPATPPNDP